MISPAIPPACRTCLPGCPRRKQDLFSSPAAASEWVSGARDQPRQLPSPEAWRPVTCLKYLIVGYTPPTPAHPHPQHTHTSHRSAGGSRGKPDGCSFIARFLLKCEIKPTSSVTRIRQQRRPPARCSELAPTPPHLRTHKVPTPVTSAPSASHNLSHPAQNFLSK